MIPKAAWYRRLDWWLILALAIALAIRIFYLNHYASLPDWSQLKVDHWYLHHWAQSIAEGNLIGDTTYFRAPMYAYLLGLLYYILGDSFWVARLLGLAIGLATLILVYLCGRRAFGKPAGFVAALLYAVYPITIYFESEFLVDPLFSLLLVVSLHRFLIWNEFRTPRNLAYTAVLIGLSAIARPTILALVPLLIIYLMAIRQPLRNRIINVAILFAGLSAIILPIFLRNLAVARDPVLIASQGGVNFYIGNHPGADGASANLPEPLGFNWRISDVTFIAEQAEGRTLKPGEVSDYWYSRAWEWIRSNPVDAAELYARKLWLTITDREISNNRNMDYFFHQVPYFNLFPFGFAILFGLAVIGMILSFRDSFSARTLLSVIVLLSLVNAAFFISSRFRHPVIPILMILAGAAITRLPGVWKQRKRLQLSIAAGIGAFILSIVPLVPPQQGYNIQPLLSQSFDAYGKGDYESAIVLAGEAGRLNDSFPEVNVTIGNCFLRLQVPDSAKYYYEKEILVFPLRFRAYANLGSLHLLNGRVDSARTLLFKARQLRPYDETSNLLWIRLLAEDSTVDNRELLTELWSVTSSVPHSLTIINECAAVLLSRGLDLEATQMLKKGVQTKPPPFETDDLAFEIDYKNSPHQFAQRKARLHTTLSYAYARQQQFDAAVASCRIAIALDSALPDPHINLVMGLISQNDLPAARSALSTAMVRFPHDNRFGEIQVRLAEIEQGRSSRP